MATSKIRVQGYLHNDLYYQFEQERLKWNLTQSQAIERILSDRYQIDNKLIGINASDSKETDSSRLEQIENRIARIESKLFSESPSESINLSRETLRICESPSELPGDLSKGISQRALARRFNCSHTFIGKLQKLGEIGSYSKQYDPAGIVWEFRDGKYHPTKEVSATCQSAIK